MQFQNGRLQGLSLTDGVCQQPEGIETLRLLHRLLKIQFPLLKSPHGHPGFRGLGDPAGGAGHILDSIQLRLITQRLAQILLLRLGQLGQLTDNGAARGGSGFSWFSGGFPPEAAGWWQL